MAEVVLKCISPESQPASILTIIRGLMVPLGRRHLPTLIGLDDLSPNFLRICSWYRPCYWLLLGYFYIPYLRELLSRLARPSLLSPFCQFRLARDTTVRVNAAVLGIVFPGASQRKSLSS